ncbi:pentapeptide repeat-containing protein [Nostoc sp.]|uniref:pentapeptide repeat-containing protein n=1 Tax=Nostoc sp. TaxID=1180 RepID=UPI003FA5D715
MLHPSMSQDNSCQNLCGYFFKGQNLEVANFSGADICSANFTEANLTKVQTLIIFKQDSKALGYFFSLCFVFAICNFSICLSLRWSLNS